MQPVKSAFELAWDAELHAGRPVTLHRRGPLHGPELSFTPQAVRHGLLAGATDRTGLTQPIRAV